MDKQYIVERDNIRDNIKSYLFDLKDIASIENESTAIIFDRLTYLIFAVGLMPQNEVSSNGLNQLAMLYTQVMYISGDWEFSQDVESVINQMYYSIKETLPLKVGVKKAAAVLRSQLIKNPFHDGIELGVISQIIDLSHTPYLKEDLPYYSRIGLGYHSNRCVNEEWQLLSDAFYFWALATDQYKEMRTYTLKLPEIKTEKHLNELTNLNANVCSLCRDCIVGFYAFFESYINGVCLNYLYYHKDDLSPGEKFALQGKDRVGNNYLKITIRLELMQHIIGKKVTYQTNNQQQLKDDDIIKLLKKMQERRDVAVHYSKLKGEIMFSPQEWMDEAQMISRLVLSVSRKIWDACFLNANHYPYYLRELNYDILFKEAQERIIDSKT